MKKPLPRSPPLQPANTARACPPIGSRQQVMLVDDHPMTRAGMAQLLNKQPDLQVLCEAGDASEALSWLSKFKPDLLLTDITMPGRNGLEFIKEVLTLHKLLPILVISMHDELIYAERVLRAGARGYVMKEVGGEKLLAAIRRVLAGQIYLSERMSALLLDSLTGHRPRGSSSPIEKLSDREFEVFQMIGQGKSTRDIATQLHLSPKTIDVHRAHIKEKLELKDATSLVRYAVRWLEAETGLEKPG